MKKIQLTRGKFALVDDEDYEWLNQWNWYCSTVGYAVRAKPGTCGKEKITMHRLVSKTPKHLHTDHINGDKLDDRESNLRNCTRSINSQNRGKMKGSSRYIGVCWHKSARQWQTMIMKDKQSSYVGLFKSELSAAMAYDMWAIFFYGKMAKTNFRSAITSCL